MAEVLFAVTSMLSFTRLAYILPAHESLGTLQISIGKMIDDMIRCVCPALHTPAQASSDRVRDSLVPHTRPHSGVVLCFVLRSDPGGVWGTMCSAGGCLQGSSQIFTHSSDLCNHGTPGTVVGVKYISWQNGSVMFFSFSEACHMAVTKT